MTYNLDYISSEFKENLSKSLLIPRKVDKTLYYKICKDAIVYPFYDWDHTGWLVDNKNRVLYTGMDIQDNSVYIDSIEDAVCIHKNILYIGFVNLCFGHWFTDALSKLWFLLDTRYRDLINSGNYLLAYTSSDNVVPSDEEMSFFDLLGINIRNAFHIISPTKFDNVLIPDSAFFGDYERQYTKEMENIWKIIGEKVMNMKPLQSSFPSKVYFSRTKLCSSKDYGEISLEKTFKQLGYTIIYPEKLSVIHKIQLMQHCEFFASTEGSTSHLTIFCKSGTNIIIFPRAKWVNPHQLCCNEFADLNVTYIEADHSTNIDKKRPWQGPFYFCITPYLEKYVGHRILHMPYFLHPDYWRYSYRIYRSVHKWVMKIFHK